MGACLQTNNLDYCNLESIDTCSHIAPLKFILNQYISDSFKINYKDIDILRVLNDYLHVMEHHADDQQFEEIVQSFPVCDIYKCGAFRRNNRNRNLPNNHAHEQKQDEHETSIIDIFDKIHCYFCHCYDVGNRLTTQEKDIIVSDIYNAESKHEDPISEQLVNRRMKAVHSLLCTKRKQYENIYNDLNINKRVKIKFNQFVETNENSKNTKTYSFGFKFEYDPYDIKDDDPINAHLPEAQKKYVSAKYADLKEEITNNSIAALTILQYHNEYRKAEIHFKSLHNKTKFKDIGIYRESENDNYMALECILSLMIYCNYDVLQYEFSKTYREENGAKHANFYFLGKYMKHAFSQYHVSSDHTNIGAFYHGISEQMVLPAYVSVQINTPLSTSSSREVAINFTNDEGLVIAFGLINGGALSVSWLSDYANEREYLFIQNNYTVSVEDILDPTIGYQYGVILQSLNWIHEIVSVEGDARYIKLEPEILLLMAAIIKNQLSLVEYTAAEYTTMKSLGVYGQEICNVYFQNQTEIRLDVSLRKHNPDLSFIWNLLLHSNCEWINLKVISALFPNLQKVNVFLGDAHLTLEIFDTMLVYLKTRKKLNISAPKLVTIGTIMKQQVIASLVDKYSDSFKQHDGCLLYDPPDDAAFFPGVDAVWLNVQM